MVNIGVFHKAYPDPHAEQGEMSAAANPDAEEEETDSDAEEVEPTNEDVSAGNPDMAPPSDEPAAPWICNFYMSCNNIGGEKQTH